MATNPMLDPEDEQEDEAPEAADAPEATPAPINPTVAAYLQSKSKPAAPTEEDEDVEAAQKQARVNQLHASLGRAAGTLAHSVYGSTTPVDNKAYDKLDEEAQAPVTDILTKQKADAAEADASETAESRDPSSAKSKAVQSMIQKLYPGKFTPDQLAKVSAADAQDVVFKPLELDEKIKASQQIHADAAAGRKERESTHVSEKQANAYTAMRKDLESFRGNQSAQQAALAVFNSDKALGLVKSVPTPQNLNLLADEMGKIATGGVPGEHGVQALLPNNLYTKAAEIKSWVTGHPNANAADVSEYLKNNEDYINQIKTIAGKTLHDYRTGIAKGYRDRVHPDKYSEAVADYNLGGDRSPDASPAGPPTTPQTKPKSGSIVQVKGKRYRVGADGDSLDPL